MQTSKTMTVTDSIFLAFGSDEADLNDLYEFCKDFESENKKLKDCLKEAGDHICEYCEWRTTE